MKPLNLFKALILLFSISAFNAIGQSSFGSKVVHHYALDTRDMDELVLNLPEGSYELRTTSSQRLLINLTITTNASSEKAVQVLTKQGRYELVTQKDNTNRIMSLNSKENRGVIFINGKELKEDVRYLVYIPKHLIYKQSLALQGDQPIANK
jgi:hypothetical protein